MDVNDKEDAQVAYEEWASSIGNNMSWDQLPNHERYVWRSVISALDAERAKRSQRVALQHRGTGRLDPNRVP